MERNLVKSPTESEDSYTLSKVSDTCETKGGYARATFSATNNERGSPTITNLLIAWSWNFLLLVIGWLQLRRRLTLMRSLSKSCRRCANLALENKQQAKLDYLEARSHWKHISIVGIEGKAKSSHPMAEDQFNQQTSVDQAHSSPIPAKEGRSISFTFGWCS